MARKILISAGEASGDFYATGLIEALRRRRSDLEFFGCAQPKMLAAGVRPVIDAEKLGVVGLVEVVKHLPGIYGEYQKLLQAARDEKPDLAILTDSPDFHLRVARHLHEMGIPVVYLVAPQAWAWRPGRVKPMRRDLRKLLCIFPFEEAWFRERGVPTCYIGHPLARHIAPTVSREAWYAELGLDAAKPLVALLPGSRRGEILRHLPALCDAVRQMPGIQFVLGTPPAIGRAFFANQSLPPAIHVKEGRSWDLLAHCDVALAASGTVTMEAALLGAPTVSFYRVSALSWWIGRFLVDIPFYTMVNLVAGKRVIPELMQDDMSGESLARETLRLLHSSQERDDMKRGLLEVARVLRSDQDPFELGARIVDEILDEKIATPADSAS
ncbi:lipid-A-disaccharide synthase [Bryobacter aggregatus]|uniref:lipid-A-disaccharide synthase n=1 Tax=Bryobacter aggregatus TaxID=360054 RepID=UPI000689B949|nr:lipid-A-disaccharide synthase [Bryobacter aggregatus]